MNLSLSMICKGELENLKRLKPLVEDYVDEWVVVFPPDDEAIEWAKENGIKAVVKDFTEKIPAKYRKQMAEWGVEPPEDYRVFNFAAARNESFSKATGDFILWLDADDEPIGLERLRSVLETKNPDLVEAVYDYSRDEEGNSISDHVRERVVRNSHGFAWKGGELGLIHETIVLDGATSAKSYSADKAEFYVKHHSDHHDESSERNFIALLYEYLKTDGKDARTVYYLGIELFNHGMYPESIKVMQEYVKVGGWDEERFRAYIRMAEAYHQLGDKESSRNAYLAAQKEMPNRPESYLGLGESYYSDEQYAKAVDYMMTGLQQPVPETKAAFDITRYTFRPSMFIALSKLELGHPAEAVEWFKRAAKSNPNHHMVHQYRDLFREASDLNDYVKSFTRLGQLTKRLYPGFLGKLADAVPDQLMGQEVLLDFKRRFTEPRQWPDNSVVVWASQAFEEWGPDSLETGCGGSEEAVIHLTKRWAKMGYEVTVFNNCPEEKTVDGVTWKRFERFNPNDMFNVLIAWRNNAFTQPKTAKVKMLDIHDVPSLKYFPEYSLDGVTVMVKSQYHRDLFPGLPDDRFKVVNNGIDMGQFPKTKHTKNNLVWTSSYDRGLEYLLEMWSDVKEQVPDATLDVYYGFNLFDRSAMGKSEQGKKWKKKMLELLDQDGVTDHGRVNSDTVAEAYLKADVWAYPTDFPEIDCITATKAMAAGCVPITTDYAVMKERNQGIMIEGDITDKEVFEEFKTELIGLLQDEEKKEEIRNSLDVEKFDWDSVAERWADVFRGE